MVKVKELSQNQRDALKRISSRSIVAPCSKPGIKIQELFEIGSKISVNIKKDAIQKRGPRPVKIFKTPKTA